MVVKAAFFMPRRTYAIGKIFWQNFFLSVSEYEGYFLKLPLKYLMHGCQNYNLRVQRSTLRKVSFFWDFFKIVFGLWAIIVQTSGETFQQRCQNCIPRVQRTSRFSLQYFVMFYLTSGSSGKSLSSEKKVMSVLSNLHSKRRRTFWGNFFQKQFFFQLSMDFDAKCLELPAKSFQQSCKNCFLRVQWTNLRMSIFFSEIFESFWTLSDNCPDLWLKFSAAFPNVHSTCRKYFFGFFVNGSHVFLTSDSIEKKNSFE